MPNQKPVVDVVSLGRGRYVLISENRINFISGVKGSGLEDIVQEEEEAITSQLSSQAGAMPVGPSVAFMPTLDCNLHCVYCYAKGGDDHVYMDSMLAQSTIDNLVKSRPDYSSEILSIYFVGGGEPFLNFQCIENVCAHAKAKFADIEIILVSNGTFGKRQLEWLIQNDVAVRISYDGLCHPNQRPFKSGENSQKIVERNINKLAEFNLPLTVQLTITNQSVKKMPASVEYIANLGVKYIKIEPVHYSTLSRGEKTLVPSLESFVESFVNTVNLILERNLEIKIDNSFISRPTSGYYCGAGEGSNMTVTPTGEITACLEISRKGEEYSDVMMYGQCSDSGFTIDESNREILDRLHFSNYQKCQGCNLKLICGGGCPMQGGWDHGDLFTPSEYNCRTHKLLLPKLFEMIFDDSRVLDIVFDNHVVSTGC